MFKKVNSNQMKSINKYDSRYNILYRKIFWRCYD